MKTKALLVATVVFAALTTNHSSAQQTPVGYSYEQRIELAKKILEPIREAAIKDQASPERLHFFAGPMAKIDPRWTAKFILDYPAAGDERHYGHNLRLTLASKANEIDEEDLVQLIEASSHMRHYYVLAALKSLPKEKKELRSRLVNLAMDGKQLSIQSIPSLRQIARLSGNQDVEEKLQDRINEYYQSGAATKTLKAMQTAMAGKESWQQSNMRYAIGKLVAFAPKEHRKEFLGDRDATQSDIQWTTVLSDAFSREERMAELDKITRFDFGKQASEQMSAANMLGVVALVDLQHAQVWANEAPNPIAKIWANLVIAPTLAKTDKQAAVKLIIDCYRKLSECDTSDRVSTNYNFPPSLIGVLGLRVVEQVDPKWLPKFIGQSIELAKLHSESNSNSAQEQQFRAIVGVARYDRAKAEKMFDAIADDVQIHAAASFFRALMALHPDQVWEEYETMPDQDSRGIDYRIYVRNELLPALAAKSDSEFWDALNASNFLDIDKRILAK